MPNLLGKCTSKAQAINNLNAVIKGIDALLSSVEKHEQECSMALAAILPVKDKLPLESFISIENAFHLAQAATIVRKQKNDTAKKRVYDSLKQAIARAKPAYLTTGETIGIKNGWYVITKEAKKAKATPEKMEETITKSTTMESQTGSRHTQGEWDSLNSRLDNAIMQGRKDAERLRVVLAEKDGFLARIADLEKEKNSALMALDAIASENRKLQARIADFERGANLAMAVKV